MLQVIGLLLFVNFLAAPIHALTYKLYCKSIELSSLPDEATEDAPINVQPALFYDSDLSSTYDINLYEGQNCVGYEPDSGTVTDLTALDCDFVWVSISTQSTFVDGKTYEIESGLIANTVYEIRFDRADKEPVRFVTTEEVDEEAPEKPQVRLAVFGNIGSPGALIYFEKSDIKLRRHWYEFEFFKTRDPMMDAGVSNGIRIMVKGNLEIVIPWLPCPSRFNRATDQGLTHFRVRTVDLAGNASEFTNVMELEPSSSNTNTNGGCSCASSTSSHGKGGLGLLGLLWFVRRRKNNV